MNHNDYVNVLPLEMTYRLCDLLNVPWITAWIDRAYHRQTPTIEQVGMDSDRNYFDYP